MSEDTDQHAASGPPPARVVFPGDVLSVSGNAIRLGNGLVQASLVARTPAAAVAASAAAAAALAPVAATAASPSTGQVLVAKCGVLRRGPAGKLSVDNAQRRFQPAVDDLVLGVIIEAHAETYRVEIGTSQPAVLPALAFEGATKRNRPVLAVGALVYARVVVASRDTEVELSCTSPHFKKEWVTGQSLYGELVGGNLLQVSSRLARQLLEEDSYVLAVCGRFVPFELAIGMNGRVWINAASPLHVILLANAIQNSEGRTKDHITSMVQKLMQAL